MLFQQHVRDHLGVHRIADEHRHDVADRIHHRDAGGLEAGLQGRGALLMSLAQLRMGLQMAHRGQGSRGQGGGQAGGEDEARGPAAHRVHDHRVGGDIAAHHADGLAEGAFDDVDAVQQPVPLGHARAGRTVQADRMDLVEIGQGTVLAGQGDGAGQVGDVAVHRIDALEGDQFGRIGRRVAQQGLQMLQIVVGVDMPLAAAVADARDHRGVVQTVGEDDQTRQDALQGRQRRLIGHIARGEQQGRFLLVPGGQFGLQIHRRPRGARDVAGAAGTGTDRLDLGLHGLKHRRMLAHAEVVIRAPDDDVLL